MKQYMLLHRTGGDPPVACPRTYHIMDLSKKQFLPESVIDSSMLGIEVFDCLEYLPEEILPELCKKIGSGGQLKIRGVDIFESVKNILSAKMTPSEASKVVFNGKVRCHSVHELCENLQRNNFQVTFSGISGVNYIIEATKK
tara:strand:+ start:89 stop:514 length:426 start_codon:yes stop_codon:yes gene_type:complete